MRLSSSPRAQVSTVDFIAGLLIIVVALTIATRLIMTITEPSTFEQTKRQALTTSDTLMSPGFPERWNETNAIKVGLLTDDALNLTKLGQLDNYTYDDIKERLNDPEHAYWYFMNRTSVLNLTACGHGDPGVSVNATCDPSFAADKNLVRVDRFVTHNNSIIRLVVVVWD
ncbi:hypothetical protein GF367_03900 [Candidatus Woesearchaeota archaeon]|nr:hypothetical protein [Candidatus Woesearchaeota archaeon]